jgi:hypothetical protein
MEAALARRQIRGVARQSVERLKAKAERGRAK